MAYMYSTLYIYFALEAVFWCMMYCSNIYNSSSGTKGVSGDPGQSGVEGPRGPNGIRGEQGPQGTYIMIYKGHILRNWYIYRLHLVFVIVHIIKDRARMRNSSLTEIPSIPCNLAGMSYSLYWWYIGQWIQHVYWIARKKIYIHVPNTLPIECHELWVSDELRMYTPGCTRSSTVDCSWTILCKIKNKFIWHRIHTTATIHDCVHPYECETTIHGIMHTYMGHTWVLFLFGLPRRYNRGHDEWPPLTWPSFSQSGAVTGT